MELLLELARIIPDLRVDLHEADANGLVAMLLDGEINAALVGDAVAGSTGSALRAVRPPNRHITPDALCDLGHGTGSPKNDFAAADHVQSSPITYQI
jgi:hypothetical protein